MLIHIFFLRNTYVVLGVWGLSCVRQTLRNRPQPFATVRNHSREGRMAVPMGSFAKGVTFGGFQLA